MLNVFLDLFVFFVILVVLLIIRPSVLIRKYRQYSFDKRLPKLHLLFVTSLILFFCGCPIFYFWFVPATTGQFCPDFMSGHVPRKAEQIFLSRVMDATLEKDYDWLASVSTEESLAQLRELQPFFSNNYEVIWSDDLIGMYERRLRFDNGTEVYLTFQGHWPCPDFYITEREVFERIYFSHIKKEN